MKTIDLEAREVLKEALERLELREPDRVEFVQVQRTAQGGALEFRLRIAPQRHRFEV